MLILVGLLVPALAVATNLLNGMNASDALGQYDDSLAAPSPIYTKGTANDAPNRLGISSPQDVAVDTTHHRLFVADTSNNRILVYNLDSSDNLLDHVPDNVLGQTNFYSRAAATTQSGLNSPRGLAYEAAHNRLFVAENSNNRVLVFDVSSITDGMAAIAVLGEPTFTTAAGGVTQSGLNNPRYVALDASHNRLFVAESAANRVLVFDVSNITNGQNASNVIGQLSFTGSTAQTTQTGLSNPAQLAYDGTTDRLFVADRNNSRVLVFSGASISNGMPAAHILGKTSYVSAAGGNSKSAMNTVAGVAYDSTHSRLFVSMNNKVMVFTGATAIRDGMSGAYVIGQPNFTATASAATQSGVNIPTGIRYDDLADRLYVADGNSRILVYNTSSISNGMNASDLVGHYDDSLSNPQPVYTKNSANNVPNRLGLNITGSSGDAKVDTTGHRLFVTDFSNNRVLVYNLDSSNRLLDRIPDFVLGQPNFYTNTAATTQTGMNGPVGLAIDVTGRRLFVSQQTNHRIVVYDLSSGVSNGMSGSYVLGQANFNATTSGTSRTKLSSPRGMAYDSGQNRLFVADTGNNRIMVFSGSSLATGMSGALVLGQATFTTSTRATAATGIDSPYGVGYDATNSRLFVADLGNNRVLAFDGTSLSNGVSAAHVLGQTTFTASGSATTQSGLSSPAGVSYDATNSRLFVADLNNNRVLSFDASSISDGQAATGVLGQSTFLTSTAATTQAGMSGARQVTYDSTTNTLYVVDRGNSRVLLFDLTPSSSSDIGGDAWRGHWYSSSSEAASSTPSGGHTAASSAAPQSPSSSVSSSVPGATSSASPQRSLSNEPQPLTVGSFTLSDVPATSWYADAVKQLIEAGAVSGYKDANGNPLGLFKPSNPVTYAETVKMVLGLLGASPSANTPKNTSARGTWAAGYIRFAEDVGVSTVPASLNVFASASRGAVIQTLLEIARVPFDGTANPYSDLPASHPYAKAILTATKLGLIKGDDGQTTVRPDDTINRAEVAVLLSRFAGMGVSLPAPSPAQHEAAPAARQPSAAGGSYVVTSHGLKVRSQPDLAYKMFTSLDEGDTVMVHQMLDGGWADVKLPDGRTGYVIAKYLRPQ